MNETDIQTIRGGIQRVMHLAKDHWTQEPTRCGFNVAKVFIDVDGIEYRTI